MNNLEIKWHPLEFLWLIFAPLIVLTTGICTGDNFISILSAVTGTLFVILCAKSRWYCFLFGIVHSMVYSFMSWQHGFYS